MISRPIMERLPALALWSLIGVASSASVGIWLVAGTGLKGRDLAAVLTMGAVLIGLSAVYTHARPDPRIARLSRGMAELLFLTIMIGSLSYSGATLALPLWDDTFEAWDKALGFDWRFWLGLLDANPSVHLVFVVAYHSMMPQVVLAVVVLAAFHRNQHLDTYLLAYGVAALATVAVATLMPALSPLVHLGVTPAEHPNIILAVPLEFQEHAAALRDGRMRIVDLSGAQGLVTFPSFHTVCAILLLLAFRPIPYLRWASTALNGLMLLAIPVEGSHYLVDVIAGAAVALGSWLFASWVVHQERAGWVQRSCWPGSAPRTIPSSGFAANRAGSS